jgi:hypothetical protein
VHIEGRTRDFQVLGLSVQSDDRCINMRVNGGKVKSDFSVKSRALILALCLAISASAHDIITTKLTYTRDISRIFARRCVSCHGENTSVPLTSYEKVRPWAVDIKEQVLSRAMPPWGAVKGFGDLAPDHGLTQEEIMIVAAWVVGGAPEGNPAMLPKLPPSVGPAVPKLRDAGVVTTSVTLAQPLALLGIRPLSTSPVASARIVARLPGGRTQPLLWLYQYDSRQQRVFAFRTPVLLPAGSVVECDAPLKYVLEASAARATAREPQR